jgi:hypothetical protein
VSAACMGTKREGDTCTMPAAKGSDYCYLHDPDPGVANRRKRNASRAANLGNSKIGAEIRSMRLMVTELLEVTISGDFEPLIRKRLAEVVQLVQSYCRLAELEIASGEKQKSAELALPEDTAKKAKEWAEGEAEREKQRGRSWASSRPSARTRERRWVSERLGRGSPCGFLNFHTVAQNVGSNTMRRTQGGSSRLARQGEIRTILCTDFGDVLLRGWVNRCKEKGRGV